MMFAPNILLTISYVPSLKFCKCDREIYLWISAPLLILQNLKICVAYTRFYGNCNYGNAVGVATVIYGACRMVQVH